MENSDNHRYLFPLLLILAFGATSCSASLTSELLEGPERVAVSLIKGGTAEESLRQIGLATKQHEDKKEWHHATAGYRVAALLAESLSDYQKMITYARKELEIRKEYLSGKGPRARRAVELLARAYLAVNDHERALPLVREALPKFIPGTRKGLQAYASLYGTLGDIYRMRGDLKAAVKYHEEAVKVQDSVLTEASTKRKIRLTGYPVIKDRYVRHLTALVRDHIALGDYQNSMKHAEKLLQKAKEFGYRDWQGEGYRLLGDIALKKQDRTAAISYYQQALSLGDKLPMPGVALWSHVGSARVYLADGKADQAMGHLERAMKIVETLRSFLQFEELRSSFFEDKAHVYTEAVLAQLQLDRQEQAFHTMERSRSRAFLDLLGTRVSLSKSQELIAAEIELRRKLAELKLSLEDAEEEEVEGPKREEIEAAEKTYSDFLAKVRRESKEQASLMTVEPLSLRQAQELLDPGQSLLEYFVTSEKTLLWVVDKDNSAALSIEISRKDLVARLNSLRQALSELKPLDEYQKASRELYKLLIEPALSHIKGKELIVAPHDVLHYLPFQALYSPKGNYLIEQYSLSYLSSASLLQFTKEKRKAKGDKVLVFGNPDLGDPKMELKYAEVEAREIEKLYPESTVLLKKEATEEKGKNLSPQHDIVHFATHAELSEEDPLSSAILLAREAREDGRLEVREVFGMELNANLVVLSACETGLGKLSSGDELVGLTRAFIYAGTPSVVASLWKVEDSSTAALMASFHKNLRTMTKVEALREAQLEMIRGGKHSDLLARRGVGGIGKLGQAPGARSLSQNSVSTSHPYFWAPFILVGDGK